MNQSESISMLIYYPRPYDSEDRVNMTRWNKKEKYFDELNAEEFSNMDKSHLTKTKVKSFEASIARNKKYFTSYAKKIQDEKVMPESSMSIKRTWIIL
jgi:hypothetical protein